MSYPSNKNLHDRWWFSLTWLCNRRHLYCSSELHQINLISCPIFKKCPNTLHLVACIPPNKVSSLLSALPSSDQFIFTGFIVIILTMSTKTKRIDRAAQIAVFRRLVKACFPPSNMIDWRGISNSIAWLQSVTLENEYTLLSCRPGGAILILVAGEVGCLNSRTQSDYV